MNPPSTIEANAVPSRIGRSIEELTTSVSASRLTCFHQCRLKFYFRYVLGLVKPKSAALHVGSAVHAVLRQWNMSRWKTQPMTLKAIHEAFSASWTHEQEQSPVEWEGGEEEQEKTTGFKLLETYIREGPILADEKPEAVEVSVEADLFDKGLPNLIGIIDLVRKGGRIVDFKTSGKTPDPQQTAHLNDVQLSAYGVLYRHATGKQESGVELHHLVKTKNPKVVVLEMPPVSDVQEHRLYHIMESYVDGLQRKDWVPSPGLQCASCQFLAECKAWC
jgi:CRISPR/Cas system-associated exonuclease Cas4 (RecB family)